MASPSVEIFHQVSEIVHKNPDVKIVTDVGNSLMSGWGDLCAYKYHKEDKIIELMFH